MSGSDDGRIFIWSRHTGRLVNILTSDDQNVTAVAAHPSMPVLASAGSEPTIKLWSPQVPLTTCSRSSHFVFCTPILDDYDSGALQQSLVCPSEL